MDSGSLMKYALGGILTLIVGIFLIYPFVLSGANRVINRFWAPYWRTVGTVVIVGIVAGIVSYIIARIIGKEHVWVLHVIAIIVTALVGGAVMNGMVRRKDGGPIGYGRAALACLVLGIVVVLIQVGIAQTSWSKQMQAQVKRMQTPAAVSSAPATGSSAAVAPPVAATVPARPASTPVNAASGR